MGALDSWNLFETPANFEKESIDLRVTLEGPAAKALMLEASSRGISYNDMATILIQQGLFFWAKQT